MSTVEDYFGCKRPRKTFGRKTNSGLLVGIEVELENVLLKPITNWNTVKDGSLKENGMEFTIPVWHTHAHTYLKELFDEVKQAKVNDRCSVHVHCDVTDFTSDELKVLILLYTIFERPLYRFSGKRWNNIYCVPVQTWGITINLDGLSNLRLLSRIFPKYSGLNVLPDDGKLGTVEFRHMAGTKNVPLIQTWINILANLVKYAKTTDYKTLKQQIKTMRSDSQYWELFQDVFKDETKSLNYSDFAKDVEQGITFAKLISYRNVNAPNQEGFF